jgi:hypothetical protein
MPARLAARQQRVRDRPLVCRLTDQLDLNVRVLGHDARFSESFIRYPRPPADPFTARTMNRAQSRASALDLHQLLMAAALAADIASRRTAAASSLCVVPKFRDNFTRASREDSVPKQRVRIAGAVLTHTSRITRLRSAGESEPGRSGWQPRPSRRLEGMRRLARTAAPRTARDSARSLDRGRRQAGSDRAKVP